MLQPLHLLPVLGIHEYGDDPRRRSFRYRRRRLCARTAKQYSACSQLVTLRPRYLKVTPRLTMTYGLRWDINPALKGKNLANQPFTVTGLNNPTTLALAPRGTPLYDTHTGTSRRGWALRINSAEGRTGAPCFARASASFMTLAMARLEALPAISRTRRKSRSRWHPFRSAL